MYSSDLRRLARPSLAALALFATLATLGPVRSPLTPQLAAQDEGEQEEAPEPPVEPLGEPIDFTDRDGHTTIQLPRSWKLDKDIQGDHVFAGYRGRLGEPADSPHGVVVLGWEPSYQRATLAGTMLQRDQGPTVEGSRQTGAGFFQSCVDSPDRGRPLRWARMVEHEGAVYSAYLYAFGPTRDFAQLSPLVDAALASFRVAKARTTPGVPDGFKKIKAKGFVVWSDSKEKAEVAKAISAMQGPREVLEKALKGKPFDRSDPVVYVFAKGADYDTRVRAATGVEKQAAAVSGLDRACLLKLSAVDAISTGSRIKAAGANQYVYQYFGGWPPDWLQMGLRAYAIAGADDGAKPAKPLDDTIERAREAIVACKNLDFWFRADWSVQPDEATAEREVWAWTWWLKHKAPKQFRKCFDEYVATLRETGDPDEAEKAWEGVDFREMRAAFQKFGGSWK